MDRYDFAQSQGYLVQGGLGIDIDEAAVGKPFLGHFETLICAIAIVQVDAGHALTQKYPLVNGCSLSPRALTMRRPPRRIPCRSDRAASTERLDRFDCHGTLQCIPALSMIKTFLDFKPIMAGNPG